MRVNIFEQQNEHTRGVSKKGTDLGLLESLLVLDIIISYSKKLPLNAQPFLYFFIGLKSNYVDMGAHGSCHYSHILSAFT